jgi:hypothetical protein
MDRRDFLHVGTLTAASGLLAWHREAIADQAPAPGKSRDVLTVQDFGAVGDGVADDTAALQAAFDYAAQARKKLWICGGEFAVYDALRLRSGLCLDFANEAWIKPKAWPSGQVGATLSNVIPGTVSGREQHNITIINPQLDGSDLPRDGLSSCNAIGFGPSVANVLIYGGTIRNFRASFAKGGAGGKAVGCDTGVRNVRVIGTFAENCYIGFFVNGRKGTSSRGMDQSATQIYFGGIQASHCEAAFCAVCMDLETAPDGNAHEMFVLVDGLMFWNCGHAPNRPAGVNPQKSGALVLGEAQNVTIRNVKGYNDGDYPSHWPAAGSKVVGAGQSGPIGAPIWGWGRNIVIENVEYHGDCDALIRINRARALGEDAGGTANTGLAQAFRFDVSGLRHYGKTKNALSLDTSPAFRPKNHEFSGQFRDITVDVVTEGLISKTFAGYDNVSVAFRQHNNPVALIAGSAVNVLAYQNAFARAGDVVGFYGSSVRASSLTADWYGGLSYILANDTVTRLVPLSRSGVLVLLSETLPLCAAVAFRATAEPHCLLLGPTVPGVGVTTGVLAERTGREGQLTLAAAPDGALYCNNRRGATVSITVVFLG